MRGEKMGRPANLRALRLVKFSYMHHHIYAYNKTEQAWESVACWKLPAYMVDQIPLPSYTHPPGRAMLYSQLSGSELSQLVEALSGREGVFPWLGVV